MALNRGLEELGGGGGGGPVGAALGRSSVGAEDVSGISVEELGVEEVTSFEEEGADSTVIWISTSTGCIEGVLSGSISITEKKKSHHTKKVDEDRPKNLFRKVRVGKRSALMGSEQARLLLGPR